MSEKDDMSLQNNAETATTGAIRRPRKQKMDGEVVGTAGEGKLKIPSKRLATGSLGQRYGLDTYQSVEVPTEFKKQVQLARDMYNQEGIVKTVIDLMVDFSTTKMRNITTQPKSQKFFDNFCKYSDMDSIIRWILMEYYLSGDVYTYRGDRQKVVGGQDRGSVFYPYTVLNPLVVEPEGSLLFNYNVYTMEINSEIRNLIDRINRRDPQVMQILKYIPKEFKKPQFSTSGRIILDQERVARICRNKQPYQKRPIPYVSGALAPLLLKRRLREMDLATAEGTINSLMLIKVGNDNYPATPKQLQAIADLFNTGAKSLQLFWNHTIEVEVITSDATSLGDEKYKQINRDILQALGMPPVLIAGGDEGGRFANAWASIVALIERLENARRQVKRWLEAEYRSIAEENNIKEVPKVEFDRMNLREEKVFKNILMSYYDRGLLDIETVLEDSDYDYDQIKERKKTQKKDKDLFESPFSQGALQTPKSPKAPPAPKPGTPKEGGEGRPTTDVDTKYKGRSPQEGPKSTGEPSGDKKSKRDKI